MKKKLKSIKARVVKHLKGDIKGFEREKREDKALIKKLHTKSPKKTVKNVIKKKIDKTLKKDKIRRVMREFKAGKLHSGSKRGPKVTGRKQAIAISLSEASKIGKKHKKKK